LIALSKLGLISRQNFSNLTSIITVYKSSFAPAVNIKVQQPLSDDSALDQHTNTNNTNSKIFIYKRKGNFGFFKNVHITQQQRDSLHSLYFAFPETQEEADRYTDETIDYYDSKLETVSEEDWKPLDSQFPELRILIGMQIKKIREESNKINWISGRIPKRYETSKKVLNIIPEIQHKSVEATKQEIAVVKAIKRGSPLDLPKDQALDWYNNLPELAKNSYFAGEIRKKYGSA